MLIWVGKKPLERLTAFPAQKIEEFAPPLSAPVKGGLGAVEWNDWPSNYPKNGLLFHGDNKEVLAHLLANGYRGKVKVIYIDPPFDSGADYVRRVDLRGAKVKDLSTEDYSLGEQIQYTDIWANDNYLQFMYERLMMMRELLADGGAIFLHCDNTRGHLLRMLLDEVFGEKCFLNEIIWSYKRWPSNSDSFQSMHDTIFYYINKISKKHTFNRMYEAASESYMKRFGGKTQMLDEETGTRKITLDEETKGMPLRDVWELSIIAGFKGERTSYPTQKPEELLERVISVSSNPGDIVLDCFIGSGTTAAVAQKLGRRWIGCDINKGAIQTTSKRLQSIITEQIEEQVKNTKQVKLDLGETVIEQRIIPAQYSFSVYRVNDYDLQIQHNEAVNLACEHIGITRTKTDSFFEGTLGKKLVKIVPFNHPVTQLDLEQIKNELKVRPNETRDIVVVALGKELATNAWLSGWNKLRTKGDVPNKIALIELRTDKKYGKFIEHKPATAKVSIKREKEKARIVIDNFISPTIIERLSQQEGPLRPQIKDWRSMVDCVMIDPNFDGKVFTVALSDVPEKKNDFVEGEYEISIGKDKCTVAIKIIDMLGEEIIIAKEV